MSNMWDYPQCVWDYREHTWTLDSDLVGYDVDATDGRIGKIDHAASRTADAFVVVDTDPRISDGKRLVPAGAVASLDHDRRRVQVALTTAEIREAPRLLCGPVGRRDPQAARGLLQAVQTLRVIPPRRRRVLANVARGATH